MDNRIATLVDGPRKGMIVKCSTKTKEIKVIIAEAGKFCNAVYQEQTKGKFYFQGAQPITAKRT